ncbi:helix-turn-helix domain-containing protein [Streptomyces malaysiensis]|uniref:helix-turn-helix domain-containing protein n=1 Tax=Streptomyces malaysiensis TaxID=92644 RepID=UPI0036F33857
MTAGRPSGEGVHQPIGRDLLTHSDNTVTSIAKLLSISRTTLYKYVPELKAGGASLMVGQAKPAALPAPRN